MAKRQNPIEMLNTSIYRFCGNGQGIPGLPHEVSVQQARELGLLEVLQAAIQNGNYQPVQTSATHVAEAADAGLSPSLHSGDASQ